MATQSNTPALSMPVVRALSSFNDIVETYQYAAGVTVKSFTLSLDKGEMTYNITTEPVTEPKE